MSEDPVMRYVDILKAKAEYAEKDKKHWQERCITLSALIEIYKRALGYTIVPIEKEDEDDTEENLFSSHQSM